MKVFTTTMLAAVALFAMATLFTPQAKADPATCALECADIFFDCQLDCVTIIQDPLDPDPQQTEQECLQECQWGLFTCQNGCGI